MILTAVGRWTTKGTKTPFFRAMALARDQGRPLTFSAIVAWPAVWRRAAGTVEVGFCTAVPILALTPGTVKAVVSHMTISEIQEDRQ